MQRPTVSPGTIALLAWLVPGLGHFYQGRTAKGVLFSVCLLGSYLWGLYLGDWRVVYLKWDKEEVRLPYLAQLGAGAASLPAVVQWVRGKLKVEWVRKQLKRIFGGFQAAPTREELDETLSEIPRWFELGTVYTMVAGLLNILVIYDAAAGPAYTEDEDDED